MKAVLDTNVFVSGIYWSGSSDKVLRAWKEGKFEHVSSLEIIEEISKTLSNFKIPLSADDILWWENLILENSLIVVPKIKFNIVKDDPDDNKFFETALAGKADYIVSQDKRHVLKIREYKGIKTISPEEFMKLI